MKIFKGALELIKFSILIILFTLTTFNVNAQSISKAQLQDDFEKFKQSANKEFQNYKDERDKEFADLLKKRWTEFKLENSKEPESVPKPPKQPETLPPAPKQDDKSIIPTIKIPLTTIPQEKPIVIANPSLKPDLLPLSKTFTFYNVPLQLNYDDKMNAHCNEINEKGVSEYWKILSSSNYPQFIEEINQYGAQMQLNDWGYYDLINKISNEITSNKNDQTLFSFFILSHLQFDVKVAKRNNDFVLLMPFETTVYKKSYITINNRNYYIIGDDSEGAIYTFKQSFSESSKSVNLNINKNILLGDKYSIKSVHFEKLNKTIDIKFNPNLIEFYNQVPMSDLSIFFTSKLDPITEHSLKASLSPLLENKNELEAVNIILNFVQKSFEYKTDIDQFGYEKFYYPEDMFYYPYSDCEDRSVLFSHLVKSLLKLDVIGLEYKTHAACAVKFTAPINGDSINYNGQKYIVCDPTYIGASAGMTMPQFLNENPKIIKTIYN